MMSLEKRILLFPQVHCVPDIFDKFKDETIFNIIGTQRSIYDKLVESFNNGNTQVAVEGLSKQFFELYSQDSSVITSKIITRMIYGIPDLLNNQKVSFVKNKIEQFGENNLIFLAGAGYKLALDYGAKLIPTEDDDDLEINEKIMAKGVCLQKKLSEGLNPYLPIFTEENFKLAFEMGLDMELYEEYIDVLTDFKSIIVGGREKTTLNLINEYSNNSNEKINLIYGEKHLFIDSVKHWNILNSNLDSSVPFSLERMVLDYR